MKWVAAHGKEKKNLSSYFQNGAGKAGKGGCGGAPFGIRGVWGGLRRGKISLPDRGPQGVGLQWKTGTKCTKGMVMEMCS